MKTKISNYQNNINKRLEELSLNWQDKGILSESMNYTLLNTGKLVRSVIILYGLDELGKLDENAIDVACSLEMIQSYSLIHDDLPEMDNASIRRKKTANHLVYGHSQALLAGDALLTDAFLVLSSTTYNFETKNKLIKLFAEKAGTKGICFGQSLDVINEKTPFDSWKEIETIIKHKTCSLFELSFMAVGIIAGINQNEIELLAKIGYDFGLAFQIKDDLNDALLSKEQLGKNNMQDLNKNTYHKIYGIDNAKLKINQLMIQVEENLNKIFTKKSKMIVYLKDIIK